jgi:hypothetical protein
MFLSLYVDDIYAKLHCMAVLTNLTFIIPDSSVRKQESSAFGYKSEKKQWSANMAKNN